MYDYLESLEGIYSSAEVALNKQLYEECIKEKPDFAQIEHLLQQGADPLGPIEASGYDIFTHVYGEVLCDAERENITQITEIFLRYGMDIDKPKIPYDNSESTNPMWHFSLVMDESTAPALKMLLDNGLSAASAGEMWSTAVSDLLDVACGDPQNNEFWHKCCTCAVIMSLLCASYEHILNNDPHLQKFIDYPANKYDVRNFREWDKFDCYFNTDACENAPVFYRSVVTVFEKSSGRVVWTFQV